MRVSLVVSALALVSLAATAQAQSCLLYYKFDRGAPDNEAVNYGSAAVTSKLLVGSTGPTSPWVAPGKYGANMLRGASNSSSTDFSYCETGFKGPITGDLTVHWWMKERNAVSTTLTYAWGGLNSFRCFTNGVAGTELWIRGFTTTTENLVMPSVGATLQARAQSATGVCVGCVVQTVSGTTTAQWYVDGVAHGSPQSLTTPPNVAVGTTDFTVGRHTSDTNTSVWDIDEFRLCNFAATPAQIKAWCAAPSAADGQFDVASKRRITIGTTGGAPKVGNTSYGHTIEGPAKAIMYMFVAGVEKPRFDAKAFPALAGAFWYPDFDIRIIGKTDSSGKAAIKNPVPNDKDLIGAQAVTQCFGYDASGKFPWAHMSNPMYHAIEID